MASDDHDERLRRALAAALVVCLTYEKQHRSRTLAEWTLVLDVLEDMKRAEGEESENGDGPRVRTGTPRLQRVQKFSQTFLHPVRVLLGACAAGKAPKVVIIIAARGVAERQCVSIVLKDRSCCYFCQKCDVVQV